MSQIPMLLNILKQELRSQSWTYARVADALSLSENSIKYLFSSKKCSIERFEQLCQLAGTDMIALAKKADSVSHKVSLLSEEQEQEIIADKKLLLVAICVLNHWHFDEIVSAYQVSEYECIQLLTRLDQLQIIELQPFNRFKLIVAKNFRWRIDGPIHRFFNEVIQPDFFNSTFSNEDEMLLFHTGMLSRGSNEVINKKMEKLIAEFRELNEADASLRLDQRFGTSILVAIRTWEFSLFQALRR